MSITLSQNAADRVLRFIESEGGLGLRLAVRQTGCSGWAYEVHLATQVGPEDHVFKDRGVQVVVDDDSLPYLKGSHIDFAVDGLNRTFQFDNPNATEECGCGESFTIQ